MAVYLGRDKVGITKELSLSKDLNVAVPAVFETAKTLYSFEVNSNTYLIGSDLKNSGLWRYKPSNNEWKNVHATGYKWQNFQLVDDGCLISAEPTTSSDGLGLLFYDIITDTATVVPGTENGHGYKNFTKVGDNWLLAADTPKKPAVFITRTRTVQVLEGTSTTSEWSVINAIEDGKQALITTNPTSGNYGIVLYDSASESFKKVYEYGSQWGNADTRICKINNKYILLAGTSYSSNYHTDKALLYDPHTQTTIEIGTISASQSSMKSIMDKVIITTSTASANIGFIIYDASNGEFTQHYAEYNRLYNVSITEHYAVISTDSSGNTPMTLLYNPITNDIKKIADLRSLFARVETATGLLLTANSTSPAGVYYYDIPTESFSQVSTKGAAFRGYHTDNLIWLSNSSNATGGVLVWEEDTKTLNATYTSLGNYTFGFDFDGYTLLVSGNEGVSTPPGVLMYDYSTKKITQVLTKVAFNTFTKDEDFIILEHTNKAKMPGTYKFDPDSKTFKLIKYLIGVV